MSFYPRGVAARFNRPRHSNLIENANAEGTSASFECGSFVRISLRIEETSGLIVDASFRTNGCGFMVATADALIEQMKRRSLPDLHGSKDDDLMAMIADELGEFPSTRRQCAEVVFEALRAALAAYRSHIIEEFQGEKALICTCFGVTEDTIVAAIASSGANEVEIITDICRAGSGCGSCRMMIQELIDAHEGG